MSIEVQNEELHKLAYVTMAALSDLRRNANIARVRARLGEINSGEYVDIMMRYKRVRDALYHSGYLEDDWDDIDV